MNLQTKLTRLAYLLTIYSFCTTLAAQPFETVVIDPDGLPVPDMVVYMVTHSKHEGIESNVTQELVEQKNKSFFPFVNVLQKGQSIRFENTDDITHHVYSVAGNNRFEFKLRGGEQYVTQPLQHPEEVAMGCNIHDWMSGFALVVDTPFFGKTDVDGKVNFDLPASGTYTAFVWHPQLEVTGNRLSKTIILDNKLASLIFQLPQKIKPASQQSNSSEFEFLEDY
ncbi:hypothetical protein [Alteromonas oceanisediminis]|uniref:hypothetical protein n=1 Tax=Alteromonas oceanisediminis TaxID=2836180 RepID=UPI001BDAA4F4|nr:hypothetical protein [Alteromonas oceanisediminis]MBT0587053.1 hypothetical protein [Alteromonas oceanisediminis]